MYFLLLSVLTKQVCTPEFYNCEAVVVEGVHTSYYFVERLGELIIVVVLVVVMIIKDAMKLLDLLMDVSMMLA